MEIRLQVGSHDDVSEESVQWQLSDAGVPLADDPAFVRSATRFASELVSNVRLGTQGEVEVRRPVSLETSQGEVDVVLSVRVGMQDSNTYYETDSDFD